MAEKEATVYIVDVGLSMGQKNHDRSVTDLEWAMEYVWDKITSIMALERKTTLQAVVTLKSDNTQNELGEEESFANIAVLQDLTAISLSELKRLRKLILPSETDSGDAISAIVIAIQMIARTCKRLKYKRKIVLVTNGLGSCDPDNSAEIARKVAEDGIELVVLGVDFDDPDYGFKEEDKSPEKAANEAVLREFTELCEGAYGTLAQAIDELGIPRLKSTRPVPSYKGLLTLGDPNTYDTAMTILVERYPRTSIRRPATASSFVPKTNISNGGDTTESSDTIMGDADEAAGAISDSNTLAMIRNARTYEVIDENAPGGKRDIDAEDPNLAKGYEYGRTAVHVTETDMAILNLETKQSLEIIGFVLAEKYKRYMGLSKTNVIIAQRANSMAVIALSSFIRALAELEYFAVARLVVKDDKPPVLVLLSPLIEPDFECLIDVELPFAEDVREYKFPPLDRVVTVSGKILKEHRHLPDDALMAAMEDYVDGMDISTFGKDDEGNPKDYLEFEDAFSPVLHRIDQAIRFRAVHPDKPLPPPYEILTRYSNPPAELVAASKERIDKLIAAANVKTVPPKAQSRRRARETVKPSSGLDVNALLASSSRKDGKPKTPVVDPKNPIPSFKQALDTTTDPNGIQAAAKQLGAIIESQISKSFGDAAYEQALEEMTVLRDEMVDLEEPGIWNEWVKGLKEQLLAEQLGGDRREFWWEMRRANLGLVEGEGPGASDEDVKAFLAMK